MTYNVAIVQTGGTIGSEITERGIQPTEKGSRHLQESLKELKEYNFEISQPVNLDSSNMLQSDRIKILKDVEKFAQNREIHGIVITHGTDTITQTSHMAFLGLKKLRVPVVFTGALRNQSDKNYDGNINLENSCYVAAKGKFSTVLIYFNPYLFSVYTRKHGLDLHNPFSPVNYPPVSVEDPLGIFKNDKLVCRRKRNPPYQTDVPFYVKRGERGKVRPIVFRKIRNEFPLSMVRWYTDLKYRMLNSTQDSNGLMNEFEEGSKNYGIDGDALRRTWISDNVFFDEHFDLYHTPIFHYAMNPFFISSRIINAEGIVVIGAGDGHLPLTGTTKNSFTYRNLLEGIKQKEIRVAMTTESGNPVGYKYEIGRELAEMYNVFTGGMLSPIEAQIRLAYVVDPYHRDFSRKVSEKYGVEHSRIEDMLFSGGALFSTSKEREYYERIKGISTAVDLLDSQLMFEESALLVGEYLSKLREKPSYNV